MPATRSVTTQQRSNRRRTLALLALGAVWMPALGWWAANLQLGLLAIAGHNFDNPDAAAWALQAGPEIGAKTALAFLIGWALLAAGILLWPRATLARVAGDCTPADDDSRLVRALDRVLAAAGGLGRRPQALVWSNTAANAFAVGRDSASGTIVVTSGLLSLLDDSELDAVVAHEVAHLENGDSALAAQSIALASMVILVALAGGLTALALIAVGAAAVALVSSMLAGVGSDGGGDAGGALVGLAILFMILMLVLGFAVAVLVVVVGYCLLLIPASIAIRAAASGLSHERELLADACAAQWTRDPAALMRALSKVAGNGVASPPRAAFVRPLLFADAVESPSGRVGKFFDFLTDSHPPLDRRLAALAAVGGSAVALDPEPVPENSWSSWREGLWNVGILVLLVFGLVALEPLGRHLSGQPPRALWKSSGATQRAAAPHAIPAYWVVTETTINVRSGPGTSHRVVGKLRRGTRVVVVETATSSGHEKAWSRVRRDDDNRHLGWVATRLITPAPAPTNGC